MRRRLLGAAAGIAAVTALSRVVGFGRTGVLSRTLGPSCVGDAYAAANAIPNVVFEVVAGGALAALVVPLLAGPVAAGDREAAGRTVSALLSWTALLLAPLSLAAALLAGPLLRAVVGPAPACGRPLLDVGGRMLVVFAPQVLLYGVGLVLAGTLQAHRRFLGPALAPLLSSLVVITAYLLYAAQGPRPLPELTRAQELTLSVGTTAGVAVLSLGLLVPLRRCGLRLRPTLAFPPGAARRARGLAVAGVAGLAAQQAALVVALRLAATGRPGAVVLFTLATALFLLPWAVLAVPVATSAFPDLAAAGARGDAAAYAARTGRAVAAVVVVSAGAAAVLAAVADPVARLLVAGAPGPAGAAALAAATRAFAPGLLGYGLLALLARALYAAGDSRTPAVATVTGWAAVAVADLVAVAARPGADRVVLLGLGNSLGMTVAGAVLLRAVARAAPGALAGLPRSAAAAAAGAAAVLAAAAALPDPAGPLPVDALAAAGVGALLAGLYLLVVRLVRPGAVRELLRA